MTTTTKEMAEAAISSAFYEAYGTGPMCAVLKADDFKVIRTRLTALEAENATLSRTLAEYRKSLDLAEARCRELEAENAALRDAISSVKAEFERLRSATIANKKLSFIERARDVTYLAGVLVVIDTRTRSVLAGGKEVAT